jgi:hypothetical protein
MTSTVNAELIRLGDDLERAAGRNLAGRRAVRIRRLVLAVAAATVLGAGSAVAAGVFTPKQVAAGMPAGATIFGGTHPTCTVDADVITYHCTLASPPKPEAPDFRGSKQLLGIDKKIAGGCVGQDDAGLNWDCWIGNDAVKHQILAQDLLGQPLLEPSRG